MGDSDGSNVWIVEHRHVPTTYRLHLTGGKRREGFWIDFSDYDVWPSWWCRLWQRLLLGWTWEKR